MLVVQRATSWERIFKNGKRLLVGDVHPLVYVFKFKIFET